MPVEKIGRERRQYERVGAAVCAWVTFRNDRAAYSTLTVDLGSGGAQFTTLREVGMDEKVRIHIELPTETLECGGEICWRDLMPNGTYAFGVRFVGLDDHKRSRLERFLTQTTFITTEAPV